jgi:hypothetical protein
VGVVGNRKFYKFYVWNVRGRGDVEDNNLFVIKRSRVEEILLEKCSGGGSSTSLCSFRVLLSSTNVQRQTAY